MADRVVGTVKFFNTDRGYGFIQRDDGEKDVFVHSSAVEDGNPLLKDDRVEFSVEMGEKGPMAVAVEHLSQ